MLINDRKITICAAGSRRAASWPAQETCISDLWERLRQPTRGTETMAEYLRLKKPQQDDLKDVGGFVAGTLRGGHRKSDCVTGRDLVTLDLDRLPAGGTEDILRRTEGLGCGYCVYSTRKHRPEAPRLRLLLPLDRTVTADEYEPIARKVAEILDPSMEPFDPTTFQASRLMYWPSCCSDGEYIYQYADRPLLSADGILQMYGDWRDIAQWPQVPGAQQAHMKLAAKQGDPLEKPGIVGAFCRCYNIYEAMGAFLPGIYTPTDMPDRYTFAGGSTTGGAIVYEGGQYLYSHHATDPAGGRLCNAFDLVRLHRFGELDEDAKPDTPVNKLPSFVAMAQLARQDGKVAGRMDAERYEAATADFALPDAETDTSWMRGLAVGDGGKYDRSIRNVVTMLEGDPRLKGKIRLNTFSERLEGTCPLPWAGRTEGTGTFQWLDSDDAGLRDCVEQLLGFRNRDAVDDGLSQVAAAHSYNPVVDYLQGLQWDGKPRLDTIFIDYFGDTDISYTRAVARKSLVAAVARAMDPGIKFDQMTVILGPQGVGKSTWVARLGGRWFSNSVGTFEGKEAAELLQGNWIIEIGELEAMNKSDVRAIKQFLSRTVDEYRAAYGRRTERHPRRCVFFGTTNDHEYLKDPTGNRRFWPIECGPEPKKSIFEDLTETEAGQIWAEAYVRWQMGESLVLSKEDEEEAERRRQLHMERDDLKGQIEAFLDRRVPSDWSRWDLDRRTMYWGGQCRGEGLQLIHRDRVCALEVLRECLGDRRGVIPQRDTRRVNAVLAAVDGWEPCGVRNFGASYGKQRGYRRVLNFGATDRDNGQEISVTEVLPEKVVPQQFATDENQVLGQTVAPKIP